MRSRWVLALTVVVTLLSVASTGCVSKKMFRKNTDVNDTRVAAVETGVEANERRIKDLSDDTDSKIAALESQTEQASAVGKNAMTKAEQATMAADRAALGRLIWEVTLDNDQVKFSFNQAEIPSDAAAVLDDLVQKILGYDKAVFVEIQGHTDAAGNPEYNQQLGYKRAMTVRDYMAKGGVPLHAMNVISLGEEIPVADNDTPSGRAQNRRVVVRVLE